MPIQRWRRGAMVTVYTRLHLTKPDLMLRPGSNPAHGMLEV